MGEMTFPFRGLKQIMQLPGDQLVVKEPALTLDGATITITGTAACYGDENRPLRVVFTSNASQFVSTVAVDFETLSLQQAAQFGIFGDFSNGGVNELPDIAFDHAKVRIDADARVLTLSSDTRAGRLDLGVSDLDVQNTAFGGTIRYDESGAILDRSTGLKGTWQISGGVPVSLRAYPALGWQLAMEPGATDISLGGGLADLAGFLGEDLGTSTLLPAGLAALGSFALQKVSVRFAVNPGRVRQTTLTIGTTEGWTVVPGALDIRGVTFTLTYDRSNGAGQPVVVTGNVVGRATILGADTVVTIPIPALARTWTLDVYPNLVLPSLGDLATLGTSLIGSGADTAGSFPASLGAVGGLTVQYVGITFDPAARTLGQISFQIVATDQWTVVPDYVAIDSVQIALTVAKPLTDQRSLYGAVNGYLVINQIPIGVTVFKPGPEADWCLRISASEVQLPGLPEVAELVGGADFAASLPEGLQQITDISITDAEVGFNLSQAKLSLVQFTILSPSEWQIISGYFGIGDVYISLRLDYGQAPVLITGQIGGTVVLVGVAIGLSAERDGGPDGWVLKGELVKGNQIVLNDLINWALDKLLPGAFTLPEAFPTVALTEAEVSFATGSDKFHISGTSTATWSPTFAGKTMPVASLKATLDTAKAGEDGSRPYTFRADGDLAWETLQAHVTFQTSSLTDDTVLTATLTAQQVQALNLTGTADSLTRPGNWAALPMPTYAPALATAGLYLNLTKKAFILHGSVTDWGKGALLVQKQSAAQEGDADQWGFAFAVALAPNWKFSQISSALQPIDEVLTIEEARLAVASFATARPDSVTQSLALVPDLPDLTRAKALGKGMNFYAKLNFSSSLFAKISQVVSLEGPYTVSALILPEAGQSEFTAGLGTLTILNMLSFRELTLKYKAAASTQIELAGTVAFTVDQTTVAIPGSMVVNDQGATFAAGPVDQSLPAPLGMTGITLRQLSGSLAVIYATEQQPRKVMASLSGSVDFIATPGAQQPSLTLAGKLLFQDGMPVLASVALVPDKPLSMGDFFATVFANRRWSDLGFMNIAFVEGSIYYARCPNGQDGQPATLCTFDGRQYRSGFNVNGTFKLFDQYTADVDVTVQTAGVTATGQLRQPIDLTFAAFTDKQFSGRSPAIGISTVGDTHFFLESGFQLLGENFATADVSATTNGLTGTLTYTGSIEAFKGTSFTFTYDKEKGFQVGQWPINLRTIAEFEEKYQQLMSAYQKGGCMPIGNLIFKDVLSTRFVLRPSLAGKDGRLTIVLKGRYEISLRGQKSPFLYVEMPELPFVIPSGVTLSNLPEKLGQFIVESAQAIIQKILDDPAKFTAFMGTVLTKEALQVALNNLICNGRYGAQESSTAVEGAQSAASSAGSSAEDAAAAATPEAAAAAAGSAAVAAEAAAAAAAGPGAGLIAAGAAGAAGLAAIFAAAAAAGGGGKGEPVRLDKPNLYALSYDSNNNIVVEWGQVYAPNGYAVELLNSGGSAVASQTLGSGNGRTTFGTGSLSAGAYRVRMQTRGKDSAFIASDWATSGDAITLLAVPSGIGLQYANGEISVTWSTVSPAPAGYEVALYRGSSRVASANASSPPATFATASYTPGEYTAQVRTRGNDQAIASDFGTSSGSVVKLPAPADIVMQHNRDARTLTVQWGSVAGATRYQTELINTAAGDQLVGTADGTEPAATLDVSGLEGQAGATYRVRVRALGDSTHADSDYGISAATIAAVAAPAGVTQSYDLTARQLKAQWDAAPGAAGYLARVVNTDQQGAVVAERSLGGETSATFEPDQFVVAAGGQYQVQVCALGDATHLNSGFASAVGTIPGLAMPAGVAQVYEATGQRLVVSWSPVAGASGYLARLVNLDQNRSVVAQQSLEAAAGAGTFPVGQLPAAGGRFQAEVRAQGAADRFDSLYAAAPTFLTVLAAPDSVTQTYDTGTHLLNVTWTAVAGAAGYEVQLINKAAGDAVVAAADATGTSTTFDPAALPVAFGTFQARVRATGDSDHLSSQIASAPTTTERLAAPTDVGQTYDGNAGRLNATWAAVARAAAYEARVIDLDHDRQVVATQSAAGDETHTSFDPATFATSGGNYLVQVKATGGEAVIDSALGESPSATRINLAYALNVSGAGAAVAVPAHPGFNVGTGDFTVEAWIKPAGAGTIISRKGTDPGPGNGGFLLVLKPDGTFKLATDNGFGFYEVNSQPTPALDGQWHHVAGVRRGEQLSIYLDGAPLNVAVRNNGPAPMNTDNNLRLLIGRTDQAQESYGQFSGLINDAKFWSRRALSQAEIVLSMEGLLSAQEPGLAGYWPFRNRTADDLSSSHANGTLLGPAAFAASAAPSGQVRDAIRRALVANYPLQGDARDIVAGRNGTPTAQVGWGESPFGRAATFLQSRANIELPYNFPQPPNYTLSAWVYLQEYRSLDGDGAQYGNLAGRLSVRHSDGQLAFWFYYNSTNQALTFYSRGRLGLQKWQHVLVAYNHGSRALEIYIDGVLDSRHDLSGTVGPTDQPQFPNYSSIGGFRGQPYVWGSALNGAVANVLMLNTAAAPQWISLLSTVPGSRSFM